MSIPVSIDPMGTLGNELDFVQPYMTGPDTWREPLEKGSCGMVVEVTAERADWKVLNRRQPGSIYDLSNTRSIIIAITFDKPVKLTKVVDYGRIGDIQGAYGGTSNMYVQRNGVTVTSTVTYNASHEGVALIGEPMYSDSYTIIVTSIGWDSYGKFELVGKIKP